MTTRRAAAALATGAVAVVGLAGCGAADPAAVAGVGLDGDGYFAVVRLCDEGRSLTHAGFEEVADGSPAVAWVGRSVEPITFYRLDGDPPDNWVEQVEGGLVSDVAYVFTADDEGDLSVSGPEFALADLNALGTDEVIAADGTVSSTTDFLDGACGG